jgi:hypothetical protein
MNIKLKKNKKSGNEDVYLLIDRVDYEDPETDKVSKMNVVVAELRLSILEEEIKINQSLIMEKEEAFKLIRKEHLESVKSFNDAIALNQEYIAMIVDSKAKANSALAAGNGKK